jgi:pentatricopeptide repeat protein
MKLAAAVVVVCALGAPAFAQSKPGPITPAQRAAASDAFQRADWAAAAKAYEAQIAVEDHPMQHGRLGVALVELGRPKEAIPHLEKGFAVIAIPRFALCLARAYARLGDTDKAYAALDRMVASGGVATQTLSGERDLAALANQPRFKAIVAKNLATVEPCRAAPEYRQFDFWLGDWTVTDRGGNFAGTSSIQLLLSSCTLLESWTGSGSIGKSFNIYDATDKKWHQTWVDDRGTFTHYIGGLVGGSMVITANNVTNGKPTLARMTFSKQSGGEVRQHGESSADDGKTWTTSFDLVYTKKN